MNTPTHAGAATILVVPGYHGSGAHHWQTWLEQQLPQARRVKGINWEQPALHHWAQAIIRAVDASPTPVLLVAHSFGCLASAVAIENRPHKIAGTLLVAPADPERFSIYGPRPHNATTLPGLSDYLPEQALHTLGLVVGSRNDPWITLERASTLARRWQLGFYDAGNSGHINAESGHGAWPLIKLLTLFLYDGIARRASQPAAAIMAGITAQHPLAIMPAANSSADCDSGCIRYA